jgi:glycosyltransferase involved in cell wall biosynthesis
MPPEEHRSWLLERSERQKSPQTMSASASALPLTIITHEFSPMRGGIATFVEEIAGACHELGQRVEVWAPRGLTPSSTRFPYPVHRVPVRGTQDLICQARMIREMLRHRTRLSQGIVYLAEPGPLLAMSHLNLFRAFRPARLVLTFHGSEVQRFASRPAMRLLVGRLIRSANRITTLSRYTRDLLHQHFPAAGGKIVVTPGAPRAGFCDGRFSRVRASDKVVILSVGRLHPRKGQMCILEALEGASPDVANRVEYWIVGRSVRGNYEAELRQRARRSPVTVHFFGNVDNEDLKLIYGRADIFAMTSVNHGMSVEGFGIAYLEASSFGLPVVGHAIGGVPEAVRDGETGLLVQPGDPRALTEALRQLVLDRELRERLGANGVIWAGQHSWRDSARALLDGIVPLPARHPDRNSALQPA